jgi:hypothetical protein
MQRWLLMNFPKTGDNMDDHISITPRINPKAAIWAALVPHS